MNQKEKEELKKQIIETIEKLNEVAVNLKASSKPVSLDNPIGRITRIDAIGNQKLSQATLENTKTRLIQLENSLKRIDDPNFGQCTECENPIPFKRLVLMPESTKCVKCAK